MTNGEDTARQALFQGQHSSYCADPRSLIDAQPSTLPDGQRVITLENAAGLRLVLLPDRGLDLWAAAYRGIPLTWLAPGSPQLPDFGQNWLQQFNGGLLVTCGLTQAGAAETDPVTGEERPMHGPYSQFRAQQVSITHPEPGTVEVRGSVWETSLFGTQLALHRVYRMRYDSPALSIHDTVTNHGDVPAPLMLLYHFNFGFPIVREGTEMLVASRVYPRDSAARSGHDRWAHYEAPTPEYPEQVFFHHPITGADQRSAAALVNDDFGVALSWDAAALPHLTQWKNTRQTHYVSGIEPGTCLPEGQNAARAAGRLHTLEAGETREFALEVAVLPDAQSVRDFRSSVEERSETGTLVPGYSLEAFA